MFVSIDPGVVVVHVDFTRLSNGEGRAEFVLINNSHESSDRVELDMAGHHLSKLFKLVVEVSGGGVLQQVQAVEVDLVVEGLNCHKDILLFASAKLVNEKTVNFVVIRSHGGDIIAVNFNSGNLSFGKVINKREDFNFFAVSNIEDAVVVSKIFIYIIY